VRQAISYGINRSQLNVQGETGYEPPVNSTSGLLLAQPTSRIWTPHWPNNLPATGDAAKVTSILKADGYTKSGGKWAKNGKTINVRDPGSGPVQRLLHRRPDHLASAERAGLPTPPWTAIGNPTVWGG